MQLLFVCTGNLCRSPLAEAIARRELTDRMLATGERPAPLQVASAGTHAVPGTPAASGAVAAAARVGATLEHHYARRLDRRMLREAAVVLCMTGEHRRGVLALERAAAGRTFLLGAMARTVTGSPWLARAPLELLGLLAARIVEQPGDEVDDPMGFPDAVYAACAARLDELVPPLVAALGGWGRGR